MRPDYPSPARLLWEAACAAVLAILFVGMVFGWSVVL